MVRHIAALIHQTPAVVCQIAGLDTRVQLWLWYNNQHFWHASFCLTAALVQQKVVPVSLGTSNTSFGMSASALVHQTPAALYKMPAVVHHTPALIYKTPALALQTAAVEWFIMPNTIYLSLAGLAYLKTGVLSEDFLFSSMYFHYIHTHTYTVSIVP